MAGGRAHVDARALIVVSPAGFDRVMMAGDGDAEAAGVMHLDAHQVPVVALDGNAVSIPPELLR